MFKDVFLPAGFPDSVTDDYLGYQVWDSAQALCSTITGMICTQSVLESIGVGNSNASSLNATLTWILKDGIGMFGTIIFTYRNSKDMDRKIKFYRFLADIFNDLGMVLSLLAPLYPSYSIYFLCISTLFKSLCGVCGGSTRFALTQHFAKYGNVGDVSAKDGSQETLVNLVGMLIGSFVLPYVQVGVRAYLTFCLLTSAHILTNYIAIRHVVLDTLNAQRFCILVRHYRNQKVVLTPEEVSRKESILFWELLNLMSLNGVSESIFDDFAQLEDAYRDLVNRRGSCKEFLRKAKDQGWKIDLFTSKKNQ